MSPTAAVVRDLLAAHEDALKLCRAVEAEFHKALEKHGAAHAIAEHGEALVRAQAARELWEAFMRRQPERRLAEAVRETLAAVAVEPAREGDWFVAAVGDARGRETHRFLHQMRQLRERVEEARS